MSHALSHRRFWPQLKRSLREFRRPSPALQLCLFEEGFSFDLFGLFIPLLFLDRWSYDPYEIMESWGVYYSERSVVFCWGRHHKRFYMPWSMEHVKCEVLRPDGKWVPQSQTRFCAETRTFTDDQPDGRLVETHSFRYVLKSGEVQERQATIYVERREWRQRWLMWCPLFAKKRQSIDISFDDEVGERTGSWKGGVLGTGYTMKRGETPLQTLRRMEIERDF
jgi:hypothetical protein